MLLLDGAVRVVVLNCLGECCGAGEIVFAHVEAAAWVQTKARTKEDAPGGIDSAADTRADAAEAKVQELRARVTDAEATASAHREAHEAALAAQAELQSMLTAVCAFADDPRDLVACRAAEAALKAELAATRIAAADAAAVAAAAAPAPEAAAAAAVAAAPEPRSSAVEAALWRTRTTTAREEAAAAAGRAAAAEREVARLREDLEAAKDYEGSMMKEVSDTGEAFAKLQGERAALLEKLSASEAELQRAKRQLIQVRTRTTPHCCHACAPHRNVRRRRVDHQRGPRL